MTWDPADAVISIVVGEHIPKELESTFIQNIIGSAKKMIVLIWADAEDHVNNQTPKHVANQIVKSGLFKKDAELTNRLKQAATVGWIKANVQVFVARRLLQWWEIYTLYHQ